MILSPESVETFDRCPRRFAFSRTHIPYTISPLGLLYSGVEGSMTATDPLQGAKDSISSQTIGHDIDSGPIAAISSVQHVSAMAEVIGLALREKIGQAARIVPVQIGSHEWRSNLFDCRGTLHRIILCSSMDDDSLRSFAHSWKTIGELAALERSIHLTVVLIGPQRGGRRYSPWSKGYLHPVQKTLRFARRRGSKADGFTEGWREAWREQTNVSAETWLERMKVDDVLDDLIQSRNIEYRANDARMKKAKEDLMTLALEMENVSTDCAMRRSACDDVIHGACPFQPCCFSADGATPDSLLHLYRPLEKPLVTLKV